MKKAFPVMFLFSILLTIMCKAIEPSHQYTPTILMDMEYLENTKTRIEQNDPALRYAFDQLIEDAEAALIEGPFSVTNKEKLPPSGDKHDYVSYSRYWWPDPNQPNGLPYEVSPIRRTAFGQS